MRDILVKYPLTLLRTHLNKIRLSYANDLKGISKMKKTEVIDHLIKYNFDVNLLPDMKYLGKTRLSKDEKNLANVLSSALKNKRAKQNLEGMKLMKQSREPPISRPEPIPEPTPETKAKETLASAIKTKKAKQLLTTMKQSNYDEKEKLALEINKDKPLNKFFRTKDKKFEVEVLKLFFKILKNFDKIKKEMMEKVPDITKKNIDFLNIHFYPEGKWIYKKPEIKNKPSLSSEKDRHIIKTNKEVENSLNIFEKKLKTQINDIVESYYRFGSGVDYDIKGFYNSEIFRYMMNSFNEYNNYVKELDKIINKYI